MIQLVRLIIFVIYIRSVMNMKFDPNMTPPSRINFLGFEYKNPIKIQEEKKEDDFFYDIPKLSKLFQTENTSETSLLFKNSDTRVFKTREAINPERNVFRTEKLEGNKVPKTIKSFQYITSTTVGDENEIKRQAKKNAKLDILSKPRQPSGSNLEKALERNSISEIKSLLVKVVKMMEDKTSADKNVKMQEANETRHGTIAKVNEEDEEFERKCAERKAKCKYYGKNKQVGRKRRPRKNQVQNNRSQYKYYDSKLMNLDAARSFDYYDPHANSYISFYKPYKYHALSQKNILGLSQSAINLYAPLETVYQNPNFNSKYTMLQPTNSLGKRKIYSRVNATRFLNKTKGIDLNLGNAKINIKPPSFPSENLQIVFNFPAKGGSSKINARSLNKKNKTKRRLHSKQLRTTTIPSTIINYDDIQSVNEQTFKFLSRDAASLFKNKYSNILDLTNSEGNLRKNRLEGDEVRSETASPNPESELDMEYAKMSENNTTDEEVRENSHSNPIDILSINKNVDTIRIL